MFVLSGKGENCRTFEPSLSLGRDLFETTAKVERFVSSPQDSTHSGCSELEMKRDLTITKLDAQQIFGQLPGIFCVTFRYFLLQLSGTFGQLPGNVSLQLIG